MENKKTYCEGGVNDTTAVWGVWQKVTQTASTQMFPLWTDELLLLRLMSALPSWAFATIFLFVHVSAQAHIHACLIVWCTVAPYPSGLGHVWRRDTHSLQLVKALRASSVTVDLLSFICTKQNGQVTVVSWRGLRWPPKTFSAAMLAKLYKTNWLSVSLFTIHCCYWVIYSSCLVTTAMETNAPVCNIFSIMILLWYISALPCV